MDLRKSRLKLVLCLVLVFAVCLISFFVTGYYSASKPVSYLPFVDTSNLRSTLSGANKIELKTSWFVFTADDSGNIAVKTPEGEIIMSSLAHFSSYEDINDSWGLKNISVQQSNDSTISIMGSGPGEVSINEVFTIHRKVPKIDVIIRTRYTSDVIIKREALVAKFDVPVTEVYLKNRKIDSVQFDKEYWLQHEGVRFGTGTRSSLIYNTPHVSSLQLRTQEKLLFINLDYSVDHPFIRIPYQKDGGGKWIDLSPANYSAGTERENSFSIYFGKLPETTPRLMMIPYGFTAGYVFTEHADGGNLKTNRAAYFGEESILDINEAQGGFVYHKIPVTKSVFFNDSSRHSSESSILSYPEKPQFLDFLNQIYSTGLYDICLHTPENNNSNRESLNESIKFMKDNFDTKTWIDHGMYSGNLNRESFVCDGLDSSSEYYASDLWEKFDTRYFWNSATETIENSLISPSESIKKGRFYKAYVDFWKHYMSPKELNEMSFSVAAGELLRRHHNKGVLNSLRPEKGNAFPTPLFWQHPTQTKQFYSWTTFFEKDYGGLLTNKAERELLNELQQIDTLISDRGIFINHGYFVRNRMDHNIFNDLQGRIVINPFFDKILGYMAQKRDSGDLYITTIRSLLDYGIVLDSISFEYLPDGRINIINQSDKVVKGLSLVVRAKSILINGEIPLFKKVGEDIVAWFDIPGNGYAILNADL